MIRTSPAPVPLLTSDRPASGTEPQLMVVQARRQTDAARGSRGLLCVGQQEGRHRYNCGCRRAQHEHWHVAQARCAVTHGGAASGYGSVDLSRRLHHTAADRPRPEARACGRRARVRQCLLIPCEQPHTPPTAACVSHAGRLASQIAIIPQAGNMKVTHVGMASQPCTKLGKSSLPAAPSHDN